MRIRFLTLLFSWIYRIRSRQGDSSKRKGFGDFSPNPLWIPPLFGLSAPLYVSVEVPPTKKNSTPCLAARWACSGSSQVTNTRACTHPMEILYFRVISRFVNRYYFAFSCGFRRMMVVQRAAPLKGVGFLLMTILKRAFSLKTTF